MNMRKTDEENFENKEICWIREQPLLIESKNNSPSI